MASLASDTTSGEVIQNPLISGLTNPGGIAVEGPSAIPEAFSTSWFGLTTAGLLALAQALKARSGRPAMPTAASRASEAVGRLS